MTLKTKAMNRYDFEVKCYGHTDIYTPLAIFVPNMNTPYQKKLEGGVTRLFLTMTLTFKFSVILLIIFKHLMSSIHARIQKVLSEEVHLWRLFF